MTAAPKAGPKKVPAPPMNVLKAVWPLPEREARLETTIAIAYASASHAEWLWDGVDGSA
jgi:hypothetical protein